MRRPPNGLIGFILCNWWWFSHHFSCFKLSLNLAYVIPRFKWKWIKLLETWFSRWKHFHTTEDKREACIFIDVFVFFMLLIWTMGNSDRCKIQEVRETFYAPVTNEGGARQPVTAWILPKSWPCVWDRCCLLKQKKDLTLGEMNTRLSVSKVARMGSIWKFFGGSVFVLHSGCCVCARRWSRFSLSVTQGPRHSTWPPLWVPVKARVSCWRWRETSGSLLEANSIHNPLGLAGW